MYHIYIYIFIAVQLTRMPPVFLCVPVAAVGVLRRDLCTQLEQVGLLMDKNALCTRTARSICSDPAARRREDGAGLEEGGAGRWKRRGGESQKWLKAVIRCKPLARPCPRAPSRSPSKKKGLLFVVLMGSFGSIVVTGCVCVCVYQREIMLPLEKVLCGKSALLMK